MKRKFEQLDRYRFIAACLVVLLHAVETDQIMAKGVQYSITRCAVPFFFITSGFFFSQKVSENGYFERYIKKTIGIFLFWGVVVFGPILICDYWQKYTGMSVLYIAIIIMRRMFVIGAGPYWYYVSLIISISIIYICGTKFKTDKYLYYFTVVGLLLNLLYINRPDLIRPLSSWIDTVYSNNNNFIMTGLPFTALGMIFEKKKDGICVNNQYFKILFAISTVGCILEYLMWVRYGRSLSMCFVVQGIALFLTAVNSEKKVKNHYLLREASTVLFLTHWFILYNIINPLLGVVGANPYNPILIPGKVAVTIGMSLAIFHVADKCDNRFIKKVFGMKV